jgi:erythronate-4-phosphate dehydrogenase
MANPFMKLMVDDAVWGYEKIFTEFGNILALPGRDINPNNVLDCDVLIIRSRTKINEALLNNSNVCFVGSTVAGLDHVDQDYLETNKIQFASAQGCNANAVAEYVISAIVNIADEFNFNLANKTLGIIGVGNVGSQLDLKAKKLGMTTLLNDPPRQREETLENFVDLNSALSADIVSFHTPLTFSGKDPSYHLLAEHNFHLISKDTILINAARGGIIDEDIWQKTKTKANVIDCWEGEPNINSTLQQSAYWATPHIAGHSIDAKYMGSLMVYQELCKYLDIEQDIKVAKLLTDKTKKVKENTLKDTLNTIYPFMDDDLAIRDISKFEDYRRHYPERYEWHHFQTDCLNFKASP